MILADKIIQERKKNGWSQEELADKLGVTRQAVSKWEGAQTTPDLQRLLEMSKLFGVTVDYLIKDEMDAEEYSLSTETDTTGVRRVSMEEASTFLQVKKETAPLIAFGTLLCILSPICMFLLAAAAEQQMLPLSEDAAGGIGMIVLLAIVAIASSIFISCGMKTKAYDYLEEEVIETEYGVTGMVKERKKQYESTYTKYNITGTVLCLIGAMCLFAGAFFEGNEFIEALFLCVMLAIVSIGVRFFIIAGIQQASFEKLLQEGDYSIEKKTTISIAGAVSAIYWLVVTAIFLAMSFHSRNWNTCGLIWPIAGVLFPVVLVIVKLFEKKS
ncbi:MAG: helix-turn-helix transcriptional regulator [Lachnospiraceae bacterium]|nr:helix-turn-helix transcriptional regulator [Lachnospiraceae bacterium]